MQKQDYRLENKEANLWCHIRSSIIYIPGALILLYGCWLSLNV